MVNSPLSETCARVGDVMAPAWLERNHQARGQRRLSSSSIDRILPLHMLSAPTTTSALATSESPTLIGTRPVSVTPSSDAGGHQQIWSGGHALDVEVLILVETDVDGSADRSRVVRIVPAQRDVRARNHAALDVR